MKIENEAIPEDWRIVDFKNNIGLLGGYPFDSKKFNEEGVGLPLIRIRNILNGYSDTFFNGKFPEDYIIEKGDILVGMDGDFHIKKWLGDKSLLNQRILKLYEIPNSEIDLEYFYYLAQPFLDKVHFRTAGTTVKHLSSKDFYNAKFKVPSISEQQKIADIISTVDEKIAVIDQQITATEALKKGLMQRLLTKGIGHTEFKDSPLGKIPKSWKVKKIGDIATVTAGGTPSTKKKEYWGGEIPWMSSGEINLKRIKDVEGRITYKGLNNSSTKRIPKSSVLMALAGQGKTRGKVAVNEFELCTNQSLAAIFELKEVLTEFLYQNLDFRYKEIRKMSTGDGGRGGLNLKIIKSINVALPSIEEQKHISESFRNIDNKLQTQKDKKLAYQQLKKGLMQQLLTGKIRVNNLVEALSL